LQSLEQLTKELLGQQFPLRALLSLPLMTTA